MVKKLIKNYRRPTPQIARKIGDAIILTCSSLSAMVMGLPLSDEAITWTTFGLNAIGVAGKVISNFFTDNDVYPVQAPATPVQ